VKEIKSLPGVTFAHVSTSDNPADIATRGMSPKELLSSIWWKGPLWLSNPVQQWPDSEHIDEYSKVRLEVIRPSTRPNLFVGRISLENSRKQGQPFLILMKDSTDHCLSCSE